MASPQEIYEVIQSVRNQADFVQKLLRDTLGWPIPENVQDISDIGFEWTEEDLNAAGLEQAIIEGQIYQIPNLAENQPWGIFLLEFKKEEVFVRNRGLTGPLRKVLRGLVPKQRGRRDSLPTWKREHLLFICTYNYQHYRFAYFKTPSNPEKTAPLAMFGWNHGDTDIRTLCTHNLPELCWDTEHPDFERWKKAFDKQRLTERFYTEYKTVFDIFQNDLARQTGNPIWAHDYALQFLNRCMFLYFIQQKKWLGRDREFLKHFWEAYQNSGQPKDTFFENWLKVLFFEAFNNCYSVHQTFMPVTIHQTLLTAPFLNGGLFRENELDRPIFNFTVKDEQFAQVLNLLEQYNFTVSESTPLEIEVAVDAEMLGMVYETLVNIAEDEDHRGDAGIFYTPRVEVDLMCRLSVVNALCNRLGSQHRELFYKWLFAFSSEKLWVAEQGLQAKDLLGPVRDVLENLTVVDPACGSGAFLVGMLMVLDGLLERLDALAGKQRSLYERRREIISRSLYGVDVKDWACHVAELRLWLALIVEADFTPDQLHFRKEPLLPNFTFHIRCGDSLIQEVGGLDIAHRKGLSDLSPTMKHRLTDLKSEKIKFFNNAPDARFRTVEMLKQQEVLIFSQILNDRIVQLDCKINTLKRIVAEKRSNVGRQRNFLTGQTEAPSKQLTLDIQQRESEINALTEEKQQLERLNHTISSRQADIPFVWDISFAEIFANNKQGFDIVIGNPPYVRQEKITDPRLWRDQISPENKKAYKTKLQRLIYRTWPMWFGYKEAEDKAARNVDAKSDLYLYFYFYGLSLLNDKGTFCFITSNSWLDVGYGKNLQEFLLKRCQIRLIIDNKAMRSFKSADVNTAIALLNSPTDGDDLSEAARNNTVRFVMFSVPFEDAMDDTVFTLIETVERRTLTPGFRVLPVLQEKLLEDGCGFEEENKEPTNRAPLLKTSKKYLGNKWGGKYLRAPEIYWTILEKGKDKFVPLDDIAKVKRGYIPWPYNIFKISSEIINYWKIEERYLYPCFSDLEDFQSICIEKLGNSQSFLLVVDEDWEDINGTNVQIYLRESAKKSKKKSLNWYRLPKREIPRLIALRTPYERHIVFYNKVGLCVVDHIELHVKEDDSKIMTGLLNSSIYGLFREILGRINLGQGTLKTEVMDWKKFPVISPVSLGEENKKRIEQAITHFWQRDILSITKEIHKNDRRALDEIVFEILALSQGEREAVYEAIINLVETRLKKAESLGR